MITRELRRVLLLFVTVLFLTGIPVFADQGMININTASAKELCGLKRVGMKYANRIIEYRKEKGAFQSPEGIMKVRGIGRKTFEANKEIIVIREEVAAASNSE